MDKPLKYGLRAGFCFLGIMAAIILLTYGMDMIVGRYDAMRYACIISKYSNLLKYIVYG